VIRKVDIRGLAVGEIAQAKGGDGIRQQTAGGVIPVYELRFFHVFRVSIEKFIGGDTTLRIKNWLSC
jgi:hypothetical protein